jgi:hypothetical protein
VVQVTGLRTDGAGSSRRSATQSDFRALWWFRYAALFTFLTGIWLLSVGDLWDWKGQEGLSISIGALLATTMFLNVWGVIWRNQKINIASSEAVAAGGEADPRAAKAANAAGRASRVNTFFSIPMLFLMVFTAHYAGALQGSDRRQDRGLRPHRSRDLGRDGGVRARIDRGPRQRHQQGDPRRSQADHLGRASSTC